MRRAALERPRILRRWRAHRRFVGVLRAAVDRRVREPGRLRKGPRHGGCGVSRCWLCHEPKLAGRATLQTIRADLDYREWAEEYGLSVGPSRKP